MLFEVNPDGEAEPMPVDQPDTAAPLGSVPRGERRPIVPG
jgi:hypothetical protein